MTPADAAAYVALELQPGAGWPAVQEAWRRLVKRHHPDAGAVTEADHLRLLEANAAYAHLRARATAGRDGRVARRRRSTVPRAAVWDELTRVRRWPLWVPGLRDAAAVTQGVDRRIALSGRWAGHHVRAVLVLMTLLPPTRMSGRLLDLRIDGDVVVLHTAPRFWCTLTSTPAGGVDVELGLSRPDGAALPAVIAAALDAAALELVEAAQLSVSAVRSSTNPG